MTEPERIAQMTPAEHIAEAARIYAGAWLNLDRYSVEVSMLSLKRAEVELLFAQVKQGQDMLLMAERQLAAQSQKVGT